MNMFKKNRQMHIRNSILSSITRLTLLFSLALTCLTVGCGSQPNESAPIDHEKARQEHMEMMKRESGRTG